MKARLLITDDQGKSYEAEVELLPTSKPKRADRTVPSRSIASKKVDFSLNLLAFLNRYARGLKGPQKFTLLVARLNGGKTSQQVTFSEVKNSWNKMKSILGGKFNPAHANRAKVHGWVDTRKYGTYALSSSWREALDN